MGRANFGRMLQGGDRRSIGNSNRAVTCILRQPGDFPGLIECLWSADPLVRMRAADAAEKVSRKRPDLLKPFKAELLSLAEETSQAEIRWHLAVILPLLPLTRGERDRVIAKLRYFLGDRSSIVKTFAIQGLADMAKGDAELEAEMVELLQRSCRSGTPAMRARSRKLLKQFQKP